MRYTSGGNVRAAALHALSGCKVSAAAERLAWAMPVYRYKSDSFSHAAETFYRVSSQDTPPTF